MLKYTKVILGLIFILFVSSLNAQDKRERKAQAAMEEQNANKDKHVRDSLMRRHYKSQSKEVRKRMKKSYKAARRNHEGKGWNPFQRFANNRRKKARGKRRKKKGEL